MEKFCHLPINGVKRMQVAVVACGVSLFCGALVGIEGLRCFADVVVDAPLQVVGRDALVGGAVGAVIGDQGIDRRLPFFRESRINEVTLGNVLHSLSHLLAPSAAGEQRNEQKQPEICFPMTSHVARMTLLFPPEIGGNFAPAFRFPLYDGDADGMDAQPLLGTADDLVEGFGFGRVFKFRLAMLFIDPRHRRETVGIDDFVGDSALFHQCKGVDNRQKLADVVRAENGSEMKHLRTRRKVDALILHLPGIARTGGIDGPSVISF